MEFLDENNNYFVDYELTDDDTSHLSNTDKIVKIINAVKNVLAKDREQRQPLFLRIKDTFLLNIVSKILANKNKNFLIGITGESASGKTTFVDNAVKACVNEPSLYSILRCDDYYKDTAKELAEAGSYENFFAKGYSFDTPNAINLDLMKEHLIDLKSGKTIKCPIYDFVTCKSILNSVEKNPAKIILNEGLYVLNQDIRNIMDVKIYIYTPFSVIKDRWFKRAILRGKTQEAAKIQFEDVNKTAQTYIRPTMEISDVVLNGMTSQEYIEEIATQIYQSIKKCLTE